MGHANSIYNRIGPLVVGAITKARHPLTSHELFDLLKGEPDFPIATRYPFQAFKVYLSKHVGHPKGMLCNLPGLGYWPRSLPPFNLADVEYWKPAKASQQRTLLEARLALQVAPGFTLSFGRIAARLQTRGVTLTTYTYGKLQGMLTACHDIQVLPTRPVTYRYHGVFPPLPPSKALTLFAPA